MLDGSLCDGVENEAEPAPTATAPDDGAQVAAVSHHIGRLGRPLRGPGLKVWLVAGDALSVGLAMVVAYVLTTDLPGAEVTATRREHLLFGAATLPVWLIAFGRYRLFSARYVTSRLEELRRLTHAIGISAVVSVVLAFSLEVPVSRGWLVLTALWALVIVLAERELVRRVCVRLRHRDRLLRPVIVIGDNGEAAALAAMLDNDRELGYRVVGHLADGCEPGSRFAGRPVLGQVDAAHRIVRESPAIGVVIATTAVEPAQSNVLVRELTDAGVHVELSSSLRDISSERLTVRPLGRCPMMYVEPVRRDGWRAVAKRAFDIVFAALALLVLAPLVAAVAVAVKVESPGPVFFRQTRLGRNGGPFDVIKFRTMVDDAEERLVELSGSNEADGPLFKLRDDPRVTRVGAVLRRFSIDEVPQFWNVLRGDMSVVGPRPALASEAEAWAPVLRNRLRAKPGITGMWQVSGRSDASFDDYSRLDLYYVDNWSLWTDLAIVAKTVPTVLFSKGAY